MRLRDIPKLLAKADKAIDGLKELADKYRPRKKKRGNPYTHAE